MIRIALILFVFATNRTLKTTKNRKKKLKSVQVQLQYYINRI